MLSWLKKRLGLTFESENYPLLSAWQRERGTTSHQSGESLPAQNPGQCQIPESNPYARKPDETEAQHLARLLELARNK